MPITIKPFKNAPVTLSPSFRAVPGQGYKVHLKLSPPADGPQQGQFFTFIFDTSGSMGYDECKVGDDATNYHTRLDMLKLVAELLVRSLSDEDIVYLVGFSDNGMALLEPTKMTAQGKAAASAAIQRMRPSGCTNLWNSLEVAQAEMVKPQYAETLKHAIMLTDGDESYPAATHAGGTAEAFGAMPRTFTLNVMGFGAAVSPDMLAKLTRVSGGRFSNVADFTTLATTSINALATAMATASESMPVFVTYEDGTTSEHISSLIQYGQDRNIVFTCPKKPVSAATSKSSTVGFKEELSLEAECRLDLVTAIQSAVDSGGRVNGYAAVHARYAGTAVAAHVADADPASGELVKALVDEATWRKWGSKYSWAYLQALLNDHRMNFKEKGQSHLGGAAFEKYKGVCDATFSAIPKPIATGKSTTLPPSNGQQYSAYGGHGGYVAPTVRTVANVGNTNDPTQVGGCWAPGSKVLMASGDRVSVELLKRGDVVWTETGDATVEYTLELDLPIRPEHVSRG